MHEAVMRSLWILLHLLMMSVPSLPIKFSLKNLFQCEQNLKGYLPIFCMKAVYSLVLICDLSYEMYRFQQH